MKRFIVLALLLVTACKEQSGSSTATSTFAPPPSPAAAQPEPSSNSEMLVPRITVAELSPLVKSGEVTVIDVRAADNYLSAHIPGSLHIPLSFIEQEAPYLPRAKRIVTYCT
jgi:hypothetical protein